MNVPKRAVCTHDTDDQFRIVYCPQSLAAQAHVTLLAADVTKALTKARNTMPDCVLTTHYATWTPKQETGTDQF